VIISTTHLQKTLARFPYFKQPVVVFSTLGTLIPKDVGLETPCLWLSN